MKFRFQGKFRNSDSVPTMNNGGQQGKCSQEGYREELIDRGNEPLIINLKDTSLQNESLILALWTGEKMQMTAMKLAVGEELDTEVHEGDQFLRVEDGYAEIFMGMGKDRLTSRQTVNRDYGVIIPKGVFHKIKNAGRSPLRIISIYAPKEHPYGANIKSKSQMK